MPALRFQKQPKTNLLHNRYNKHGGEKTELILKNDGPVLLISCSRI